MEERDAVAGKESILPLAFCADAKFYEGLETAVCSALVCSAGKTTSFHIYVVDGGLEPAQKQQLEHHVATLAERHAVQAVVVWKDLSTEHRAQVRGFKGHPTFYVRLFLAEIIPEENWVLWIDADIFCMKDLSGIDRYLGESCPMAAAVDHCFPTLKSEGAVASKVNTRGFDLNLPYVNSGFAVLNLKLWREEKLLPELLAWGAVHLDHCRFKDQSILNWNLADRMGILPGEYNLFGHQGPLIVQMESHPLNFHAAGDNKFWALKPSPKLKHAELSFGEIVAAFHYLRFRQEELGFDESARLGELEEAIGAHPYLQPFKGLQRAYALKLATYTFLLNPARFRGWLKKKRVHQDIHEEAERMLRKMAGETRGERAGKAGEH